MYRVTYITVNLTRLDQEDFLNWAYRNGWELISIVKDEKYTYVFKRNLGIQNINFRHPTYEEWFDSERQKHYVNP